MHCPGHLNLKSYLFERAGQLPYHTQGMPSTLAPCVDGKAESRVKARHSSGASTGIVEFNSMPSNSTGDASTPDSQPQFKGDLAAPTNVVSQPITTLMISGFPYHLRSQELVDVINQQGFSGAYDLFFLPARANTKRTSQHNMGFAFVNFKTPEYATAFVRAFNNVAFPNSTKLCSIRPAREQGFKASIIFNMNKYNQNLRSSQTGSFRVFL